MMTMLRRQGMSAQVILGGLGESAAYLGVQLQMAPTDAAEFAAKLQDATQTTEKDMMSLMDVIQRGYYAGVDPGNMLQGFSKSAPRWTLSSSKAWMPQKHSRRCWLWLIRLQWRESLQVTPIARFSRPR